MRPGYYSRVAGHLIGLLSLLSLPSNAAAIKPIHQKFIGEVSYNPYVQDRWEPIKIGAVTIKIADVENEIVVSGQDKHGRPWNVYIATAMGTGFSTAWTADLDGDGIKDFLFVHHNSLNGRCVTRSILTTILFDAEGRPSPWEIVGHFLEDYAWQTNSGRGVLDIGDWNKNGRAELVQTGCYGYEHQELSYTPYDLLDVYEASAGLWKRLTNAERAPEQAAYQKVANSGFRKLLPGIAKGEFVSDFSNDQRHGTHGEISTFVATPGILGHIILKDGTSCFTSGHPGIVIMGTESTEAVFDWNTERAQSLLNRIIADKLPVTLTGQLENGICSPTLIWATQN